MQLIINAYLSKKLLVHVYLFQLCIVDSCSLIYLNLHCNFTLLYLLIIHVYFVWHSVIEHAYILVTTYSIRLADILDILISAVALCLKAKLGLGVGLTSGPMALALALTMRFWPVGRKILALTTSLTESCVFVLVVLNNFNKYNLSQKN